MTDAAHDAQITAYKASMHAQGWELHHSTGDAPPRPPTDLPNVTGLITDSVAAGEFSGAGQGYAAINVLQGVEAAPRGRSPIAAAHLYRDEKIRWYADLPVRPTNGLWDVRIEQHPLLRPDAASWMCLYQRPNWVGRDEVGDGRHFALKLVLSRKMLQAVHSAAPKADPIWDAARRVLLIVPLPCDAPADDTPLGSRASWFPSATRRVDQIVLAHTDKAHPAPSAITRYQTLRESLASR